MRNISTTSENQSGLAHISLLLLVLFAAVAGVGYYVSKNQTSSEPEITVTSKVVVPAITNVSDLKAAENTLNQSNIDSDLNPEQMSSDINSLL